ncbi:50S ribosomal protein L5 [Candidatus Woesearchaeota archaeon]|nr:MAG: 50S ribosomal protein L5 [Candidatus Woesearchaeota archaeon]
MNPMKQIKIEKVTLNVGAGKDQNKLKKGMTLLKNITGISPVKTFTNKRIAAWGLRPGLPIGCKLTIRGKKAEELAKRLLEAKENSLKEEQFDDNGNVAFGIHEYIDIPQLEYDPNIGVMGLEVCITLQRPGFRIKRRKIMKRKIPRNHRITKKEAIEFMKQKFNLKVGEEE